MQEFPPPIDPSYVPSVSIAKIPATAPTEDIIAILERDGAVILTDLVSSQDIAAVNDEVEPYIQKAKAETHAAYSLIPKQTIVVPGVVGKSPTMARIAEFSVIDQLRTLILQRKCTATWEDRVEEFTIGPLLNSSLTYHISHGGPRQRLHRDDMIHGVYHSGEYSFSNETMLGFMIAGSRTTRENGATMAIPGSHKWDHIRVPKTDEVCFAVRTMSPDVATPHTSPSPVSDGSPERRGKTLAILGCGVMGTAILLGVLSANTSRSKANGVNLLPSYFRACVRRSESADNIRSKLATQALESTVTLHMNDNVAAVRGADMVILACQPHLFKPILEEPGMTRALRGKLIMSVLAGVTSEEIERHLGNYGAFAVVRAMPNIASAVQASSTVLEVRPSQHPLPLPKNFLATAHAIFSCVGTVFTTQPDTFSICTTLNGSTPAFFAMVIDGLVDGAVALGLSRQEATQMAAATMRGTAELIMSGKATHDLRYEVACPGGSTIQGLRTLEEARTRAVWMDAMRASTSEQSGLSGGLKVQRGMESAQTLLFCFAGSLHNLSQAFSIPYSEALTAAMSSQPYELRSSSNHGRDENNAKSPKSASSLAGLGISRDSVPFFNEPSSEDLIALQQPFIYDLPSDMRPFSYQQPVYGTTSLTSYSGLNKYPSELDISDHSSTKSSISSRPLMSYSTSFTSDWEKDFPNSSYSSIGSQYQKRSPRSGTQSVFNGSPHLNASPVVPPKRDHERQGRDMNETVAGAVVKGPRQHQHTGLSGLNAMSVLSRQIESQTTRLQSLKFDSSPMATRPVIEDSSGVAIEGRDSRVLESDEISTAAREFVETRKEQIIGKILLTTTQWLRTQFTRAHAAVINTAAGSSESSGASSSAFYLPPEDLIQQPGERGMGGKRKRGYRNGDDENDDQDGDRPPNMGTEDKRGKGEEALRFACPYFKKDPIKYQTWQTCPGPGWPDVHRVKEHLYRKHRQTKFKCVRCWTPFESEKNYINHQRAATSCELRDRGPIEGFDSDQEKQLKSRKKKNNIVSEVDRWNAVFQILFPHVSADQIPSPFYEHGRLADPTMLAHETLNECEAYLLREIQPRLRKILDSNFDREFQSIEESIKNRATESTKTLIASLFREFRDLHQQGAAPTTISEPSGSQSDASPSPSRDQFSQTDSLECMIHQVDQSLFFPEFGDTLGIQTGQDSHAQGRSDSGYESNNQEINEQVIDEIEKLLFASIIRPHRKAMVYTIVVHLRAKPGKENIAKVHAKLNEASAVYSKDKETISWFVMQSVHDPQDFTIVERYENEGSQKYHLENPYWKTFDPFVIPLLEKPMDLRRFEELAPVEGEETLLK
ncbi:hypothetical protein GQX73_g8238 [Xylaria multiplex]|uniref:ABM domain-containing protein n=1 Tax=Xylaria multiplex TaxID=323545 RepID=A0A7C8IWC2_9PEZI|nr:hypothetical protein GQX73_g8238 [Xylaria multiplex]